MPTIASGQVRCDDNDNNDDSNNDKNGHIILGTCDEDKLNTIIDMLDSLD